MREFVINNIEKNIITEDELSKIEEELLHNVT